MNLLNEFYDYIKQDDIDTIEKYLAIYDYSEFIITDTYIINSKISLYDYYYEFYILTPLIYAYIVKSYSSIDLFLTKINSFDNELIDNNISFLEYLVVLDDIKTLEILSRVDFFNINMRVGIHKNTLAHVASYNHSINCLKFLIDNKCDLTILSSNGVSPIMTALSNDEIPSIDIIKLLLDTNVFDLNQTDFYYQNIFIYFCINICSYNNIFKEILDLLLMYQVKRGNSLNINQVDLSGDNGIYYIYDYDDYDMITYLIEKFPNLNLNYQYKDGRTLLHFICSNCNGANNGDKYLKFLLN